MFKGYGCAVFGPQRLYPQKEFHPGPMRSVADGFQSIGVIIPVDLPVAGDAPIAMENVRARFGLMFRTNRRQPSNNRRTGRVRRFG